MFSVLRRTGRYVKVRLFHHQRWCKFGSGVGHGPLTLMGLIISPVFVSPEYCIFVARILCSQTFTTFRLRKHCTTVWISEPLNSTVCGNFTEVISDIFEYHPFILATGVLCSLIEFTAHVLDRILNLVCFLCSLMRFRETSDAYIP